MRNPIASLLLAVMPLVALAATPQTAVLDVQNMTCALCPVTVKKSLEQVSGVSQARIDFAKKTATVTFDADKTNASALVKGNYRRRLSLHGAQVTALRNSSRCSNARSAGTPGRSSCRRTPASSSTNASNAEPYCGRWPATASSALTAR